jgi:tRNA(Ile2) C34 agmatinyltransferase TiaS
MVNHRLWIFIQASVAERPIALPPVRQLAHHAMLINLSEKIAYYYRRAGDCRELSASATSPNDKAFHSERERSWFLLARSYEMSDQFGLFAEELHSRNRHPRELAPSCPYCAASTQVDSSTIFVCTNCGRIIEEQ